MERVRVRFLVDLMLMRLGRWLRLLGQDVANPEGGSDSELLARAKRENRTIITRDKRLFQACRVAGVECVLIRSSKISDQLLEMAREGVPLQTRSSEMHAMQHSFTGSRIRTIDEVGVPGLQEALLARRTLEKDGKDAGDNSIQKR